MRRPRRDQTADSVVSYCRVENRVQPGPEAPIGRESGL